MRKPIASLSSHMERDAPKLQLGRDEGSWLLQVSCSYQGCKSEVYLWQADQMPSQGRVCFKADVKERFRSMGYKGEGLALRVTESLLSLWGTVQWVFSVLYSKFIARCKWYQHKACFKHLYKVKRSFAVQLLALLISVHQNSES